MASAAASSRLGFGARRVAGGSLGVGGLALLFGYNADEGVQRAVQFNLYVLPIALHYKAVQLSTRGRSQDIIDSEFAKLHNKYAQKSLDIVLRQKGFYVKTAQFLSQYADIIPEQYVDCFKILRDDAPAMPFGTVKAIVEDELGRPLNEVFASFETRPVGAASIGQVHAAKLLDGTEVVVKVQYPGAERQFRIDIDLSTRLASALAPHYADILRQMQLHFANEFDYRREAGLQREAFSRLNGRNDVRVPEPFDDENPRSRSCLGRSMATKNVFVMDRLHGKSVDRWASEQLQTLAVREGITADEVLRRLRRMPTEEIERLVPSQRTIWAYGLLLGVRDAIRNGAALWYNWTLGWIGAPIHYARSPRPVNIYQVARQLFEVQGRCLLDEGFFNGDPHAGNVLLLDDGRLGLIDWGQVGKLASQERVVLAKAIVAVADRDEPTIARLAWEMGVRTEKRVDWVAMKLGTFWLGSFGEDVVGELGGATSFEENLARIDRLDVVPPTYFACVRCLMLTRGVAALLGFPSVDSAVRLRSQAEACLRRAGARVETVPGRKLPRPELAPVLR
eukprot:TRINITY_DN25549_c0_g1_i1.p1 TRINITY_DN25549_c0_g1~~TRINITY_DN25549_c0_g1_i1.p1  ORF type:complete len:580 (-),score=104.04 TRINITY_DN25549_c0_g1_i1:60-1751(-)